MGGGGEADAQEAAKKARLLSQILFVRPKCFCSERIGTNFSKFASENKDSCLSRNNENSAARFSKVPPAPAHTHSMSLFLSFRGAGKPIPSDTEWSDLMKERPESERRPGGCWP